MRISVWSSDVCSSDLSPAIVVMSARGGAVFILSEMQLLGLIDLAIAYLKQPGGRRREACANAPAIKLRFLNIPAKFIRLPSTECARFHLPSGGCEDRKSTRLNSSP